MFDVTSIVVLQVSKKNYFLPKFLIYLLYFWYFPYILPIFLTHRRLRRLRRPPQGSLWLFFCSTSFEDKSSTNSSFSISLSFSFSSLANAPLCNKQKSVNKLELYDLICYGKPRSEWPGRSATLMMPSMGVCSTT